MALAPETVTVFVSVGNSDDKLTQREWSYLCTAVRTRVQDVARQIHGEWYSAGPAPFQNMCVCAEITPGLLAALRVGLANIAREYRQDSIAVTEGQTELIRPGDW